MNMPVSQARDELADLINRVRYGQERITLIRRGRPVAAIISAADLELLEQLEDAADLQAAIEAMADPENQGPTVTLDELEAQLQQQPRR